MQSFSYHLSDWDTWSPSVMPHHQHQELTPSDSSRPSAGVSWSRGSSTPATTAAANVYHHQPRPAASLLSPSAPSFNYEYQGQLMQMNVKQPAPTAAAGSMVQQQFNSELLADERACVDSMARLQVTEHDCQNQHQPAGKLHHQQQQHQQNKPSIAHEIDKWIASVTCSAPIPGPGVGCPGPNQIAIDKSTLLNFLNRLKMHYQKKREMRIELCVFCRQNQEPFHVYTSHRLTDAFGNVTCPVLFQYACPICGATGPKAHTIKYCPHGNGSQQSNEEQAGGCLQLARVAGGGRNPINVSRRG